MTESPESKHGWKEDWEHAPDAGVRVRVLEARLERAQRELRTHRLALLALAGVLAAVGYLAFERSGQEAVPLVRAHRVEVIGPDGREAVVLDADRGGGRVTLRFQAPGTPPPPAVYLIASPEGGALQLYERGQNYYALGLAVGPAGEGIVQVRRRGMQPGIELRGPDSDTSGGKLLIYDAQGKPAIALPGDGGGTAGGKAPVRP